MTPRISRTLLKRSGIDTVTLEFVFHNFGLYLLEVLFNPVHLFPALTTLGNQFFADH